MTSQLGPPLPAAGRLDDRLAPQAGRRLRILLLEDDVADAELQVRALASAGIDFTWEQVDNERAFIASLESGPYDVILSDYNLPAFNGLRALQMLRARALDVPFILVSGALGEEAAIESLKLGATDYVLKGRLDRLAAVVRRALGDAEERGQRARAEAALRESEERYRSLVETAPDIIVTLSPDGRFSSVNPAFEVVLGWPPSAWIGKPFSPIIHPDEVAVAEELFARSQRESVPTFKLRVRTSGGDYLVQEMTATAQRRDGGVVGVLVIARDVTARTRAEMKMRTLVEIAKELTGTFDLDALLTRMQERTAAALPCDVVVTFGEDAQGETRVMSHYGLAPDLAAATELVFEPGQPFGAAVSRGQSVRIDDTGASDSSYADLFRRFRLSSVLVTPLRSHDRHFGALLAANYAVRPFDDAQADLCGAIAHQVAGALEAAEFQRLQHEEAQDASALARVAHELISSVDLPILLDRLCRVTAEVLEAEVSYTLIMREEENAFVPVAGCGEAPERWDVVRAIKIPAALAEPPPAAGGDGAAPHHAEPLEAPLQAELRTAYDLGAIAAVALRRGEQIIGIQIAGRRRDATAFSPRQQRLSRGIAQLASLALENARLVDKLEQANRLKSDFLATMSHELRTPLNVILGYNDLLLDEVFGHLTPEQAASLDRVGTSARELLELISATLDISRLETSRAALNLRDIDPVALLREIETETRSMLEKPDVEAVWRVGPNLPHLYSDAVKLKVLLKNLIANAAKFTDRGSVTISAEASDGGMAFCVADTGIGMTPDLVAVIFEPFRQGDSSNTRRHGGVGLGLYIVTRLLELLAGRIEVDSQPGVGSTFRVWIQLDPLRGRGERARPAGQ